MICAEPSRRPTLPPSTQIRIGQAARPQEYDPGMSDRKTRVTVTIAPHLVAYAERLVESGKADSVSAVVNGALSERVDRDRRIRRRWQEITAQADRVKVS